MRASKSSSNQTPLILGGIVVVAILLTGAFWALTADSGPEAVDDGLVTELEAPQVPEFMPSAQTVVTGEGAQRLDVPLDSTTPAYEEVLDASPSSGGSVSGRVVDERDQPVAGAALTVYRTNNLLAANFPGARKRVAVEATSGPDGGFEIRGIPFAKRPYVIVAEHEAHARSESGTFRVRDGADARDVVVRMGDGATIRGSVIEVEGPPIANARVELYNQLDVSFARPAEQKPWRVVFTDPYGQFEFQHVASHAIRVRVVADGYETKSLVRSYALQGTAQDETLDFELRRGRDLTGRVTDAEMRPIPNVSLEATSLTKEYQSTAVAVSDQNGYFLLQGLSDDYFQLRARAQGYSPVTRQKIHVTAGQINVLMHRQGSAEGWVTNPEGMGLSSFELVLMRHRAEGEPTYMNDIRSFRGTDKGYFLFDGLEPGEYVLEARADTWADSRSQPFTIDRETADVPVQVRIDMTLGGRLVGVVFDHTGQPAAGAEVNLNENNYVDSAIGRLFGAIAPSGERVRRVKSGADGSFEFASVPPGTYQLAAKHPDSAARTINDVRVAEETIAGVTQQDIVMPPGAAIGGRALDGNNQPLPFCKVQLSQKGNGFMEVVNTDKNGDFEFENLAPGNYTITLSPSKIDGKNVGPFMTILYAQKSQREVYVAEGQQLLDVTMMLVKR